MDAELIALGETSIAKLGARAAEVQALITANFPQKSLADVAAAFEATATTSEPNAAVAKVDTLLREQAALAIEDIKAAELYISLKTPEIADGNNFGVEVQAFIEGELKKLRGAEGLAPIMDVVSAYHLARGATLEKIVKKPTSSSDEETKVEVDEGKTTTKKTTSTKQSSAQSAPLPDYVKYIAALDTKEYHACYTKLVDVRNAYIKANLLLTKNAKRLADPRGDGEGSSSNYTSMF